MKVGLVAAASPNFMRIADYLIETIDALVVFMSNATHGGYDDVYVINKIYASIKNKSSIRTLTSEYAAQELKGLTVI